MRMGRFYKIKTKQTILFVKTKLAIKLWNMLYLLFKHFDTFLNLFPSLFVPSIQKKAAIVKCLSIC